MAQHIIAIDISSTAARITVLEATFRRAAVQLAKTVPLEPELTPEAVWERVRAAVPVSIDTLVVGLDARSTSTRQLKFPFSDMKKVEAAILFELENQLPYNLDEVAVTWSVTERRSNEVDVLAGVTPKPALIQTLATLTGAGLEPRAVMLPGAALAEMVPGDDATPAAVISLGASQTHVTIVRNGLRFVRCLRVGGDDIDRVLAKSFNVSVADARQAKEREARIVPADEEVAKEVRALSDQVSQALAPLIVGLASTFKSLPTEDTPQKLVLTGGLSRLVGIDAFISARLGVPVTLLDVSSQVEALAAAGKGAAPAGAARPEDVVMGPEHAVSFGMALAHLRHGRELPLNFRRGELAYHGDIQAYRGTLTRAAVGLSVVLSLAIFASIVRYTMLRSEESKLDKGFCEATQRITGREICDPVRAMATLRQSGVDGGAVIPSFSASMMLEMVSRAIGSDLDVQFDELDMRVDATGQPERISGKGEAASFEATEQLVSVLKRDPCVQDAEVSKLRKAQGSGRVEFSLAVKVVCPVGVLPGMPVNAASHPANAGG